MYNYDIPVRRYNRNDLNEFCEKYLMSLGANETLRIIKYTLST